MNQESQPNSNPSLSSSSKTQQIVRGVIIAIIAGVLIYNWWQERKQKAAVPNGPVAVAKNDAATKPVATDSTADPSPKAAASNSTAPTGEIDLDLSTDKTNARIETKSAGEKSTAAQPDKPVETPKPTETSKPVAPQTQSADSQEKSVPTARGPPNNTANTPKPNSQKTDPKKTDPQKSGAPTKPAQPPNKPGQPRVDGLKVHDVVIKNLDGDVVYRGSIDLTKTIERIDDERILNEFRHDGVEFKNFERRLPIKPRGHYREWVHPTSGQRGPGPQRVVTGKDGEAFYTWDHYDHFLPIRGAK